LKTLKLGGNKLIRVPPTIGALTALTHLDLGFNRLQSLPPEISLLSQLKKLFLQHNELTALPASMSFLLLSLHTLNLNANCICALPMIGESCCDIVYEPEGMMHLPNLPEPEQDEQEEVRERCTVRSLVDLAATQVFVKKSMFAFLRGVLSRQIPQLTWIEEEVGSRSPPSCSSSSSKNDDHVSDWEEAKSESKSKSASASEGIDPLMIHLPLDLLTRLAANAQVCYYCKRLLFGEGPYLIYRRRSQFMALHYLPTIGYACNQCMEKERTRREDKSKNREEWPPLG
jgi:hypothetical protein